MLLSAELFERVVGIALPGADPAQRKGAVLPAGCKRTVDRRQFTRMSYGRRAKIRPDRGELAGVWDTVMIQDISIKGVGFLSARKMTLGDTFVLNLSDVQGKPLRTRCAIRRCEPGGFGQTAFLIGATFEQTIPDDVEDVPLQVPSAGEPDEAGAAADEIKPEFSLGKAMRGVCKALNPARMFSAFGRNYDDYSSTGR